MKTHSPVARDETYDAAIALIGDRLICEKELANRWSISVKMLQKARASGGLVPFRKLGGRMVRYALSDVIEYERSASRLSTSDDRTTGNPEVLR